VKFKANSADYNLPPPVRTEIDQGLPTNPTSNGVWGSHQRGIQKGERVENMDKGVSPILLKGKLSDNLHGIGSILFTLSRWLPTTYFTTATDVDTLRKGMIRYGLSRIRDIMDCER
jgi:hypothetical protein